MLKFLKILFGKGINMSPEDMLAVFTAEMYPSDKLLAKIINEQNRQGNTLEHQTIYAAACGCSMIALYGARKEEINALGGKEKFYNLIARVQSGMLECIGGILRRLLTLKNCARAVPMLSTKIARTGIENPAATGEASAWHCAERLG